jgi:hypothetical protein
MVKSSQSDIGVEHSLLDPIKFPDVLGAALSYHLDENNMLREEFAPKNPVCSYFPKV